MLSAAAATIASAQPAAERFTFEGLPWGSTEAQISAAFGPAIRYAECSESSTAASLELFNELCESPTVRAFYEIAGVWFDIHLVLSASQRRLASVSLITSEQSTFREGSDAPEAKWKELTGKLVASLTARYGVPISRRIENLDNGLSAVTRWQVSGTYIRLQTTYTRPGDYQPARAEYQVLYRPG